MYVFLEEQCSFCILLEVQPIASKALGRFDVYLGPPSNELLGLSLIGINPGNTRSTVQFTSLSSPGQK